MLINPPIITSLVERSDLKDEIEYEFGQFVTEE